VNVAMFGGAALAAISATLAVRALSPDRFPAALAALAADADPGAASPLRRTLASVGASPLGRAVRRGSSGRAPAGGPSWSREEIAGATVLTAVAAFGLLLAGPSQIRPLAPLASLLALRLPSVLVARSTRRARASAALELPVLLDLLSVATSAGLAPQLALREAVTAVRGPLGDELRVALRATDLGGRWRDELAAAAARLHVPELARTVSLLARSESLGSSLAEEVARLAIDVRESRRAAATERARTAPVKMLFPLVFLILPAFLLLTVVPVLLTTVRSIG